MTARRLLLPLVILLVAAAAFAGIKYRVDPTRCSGCGDCTRLCPVSAIELVNGSSSIDPDLCIGCGQCIGVCTHDAIR